MLVDHHELPTVITLRLHLDINFVKHSFWHISKISRTHQSLLIQNHDYPVSEIYTRGFLLNQFLIQVPKLLNILKARSNYGLQEIHPSRELLPKSILTHLLQSSELVCLVQYLKCCRYICQSASHCLHHLANRTSTLSIMLRSLPLNNCVDLEYNMISKKCTACCCLNFTITLSWNSS